MLIFSTWISGAGKGYEEFVKRAQVETAATYLRGRVSKIYKKGDKLMVRGEDAQIGQVVEVEADLVVLATAVIARKIIQHLHGYSVYPTISMVIYRKPSKVTPG